MSRKHQEFRVQRDSINQLIDSAKDESKARKEYFVILAKRILYRLDREGLLKMQGSTVDQSSENIRKAQQIAADMIMESLP